MKYPPTNVTKPMRFIFVFFFSLQKFTNYRGDIVYYTLNYAQLDTIIFILRQPQYRLWWLVIEKKMIQLKVATKRSFNEFMLEIWNCLAEESIIDKCSLILTRMLPQMVFVIIMALKCAMRNRNVSYVMQLFNSFLKCKQHQRKRNHQ